MVMAILVYIDRKNIEFKYGIIIRRFKKGEKILTDFAKRYKKLLKHIGTFAVIVGLIASLYGFYLLVTSSYDVFVHPKEATPEIKLIFPQPPGVKFPKFVQGVPFWYWIIAVFIVVSVHEPMHAIFARIENIRVKNMGFFLLFLLPLGAFADPDEKQLKRISSMKKLRIYVAGSFGNFIVALLMIGLLIVSNYFINYSFDSIGVEFENTLPDTPADVARLEGIIVKINDKDVKSVYDLSLILQNIKPNEIITITTTKGIFTFSTAENPDVPSTAFIGISRPKTVFVYSGILKGFGMPSDTTLFAIAWILGLLEWLFVINLGIGIVNLFPLKPLDGGLMFEEIFKMVFKKKDTSLLINSLSLFTFIMILINLFGPSLFSYFVG